jgi:acetyltransferase-like isoleucine patch superfamily enzyme
MKKIAIGENSWFIGDEINIGKHVLIGKNTIIRATKCIIEDYCQIGESNSVLVEGTFQLGHNSFIGSHNNFCAREIQFGNYLFLDSHVVVGHGGRFNYDAFLRVGNGVMICAWVKLNTNYSITIGDDVGIGEYVDVWTHGSYPAVLNGFPAEFGPIEIGSHVWLPAKSTVLANVKIGNNVVIGVNSLINKNLPDGCFAAGMPVKIIRENAYPNRDPKANAAKIKDIFEEYSKLAAYKGIHADLQYDEATETIYCNARAFNTQTMMVDGALDEVQEDFRDFLRRRGVKFFTGLPFKSIMPEGYKKLLSFEE